MTKEAKKDQHKLVSLLLSVSGGVFGIYLLLIFAESLFFANTFGPFTTIAGVDVSNMGKVAATEKLSQEWLQYAGKSVAVEGQEARPESLITDVDVAKSVENAINMQDSGYLTFGVFTRNNYSLNLSLNNEATYNLLSKKMKAVSTPASDASIVLGDDAKIVPETVGRTLLLSESKDLLTAGLSKMDRKIDLKVVDIKPNISKNIAESLVNSAKLAVSEDILVSANEIDYTISKDTLNKWLKINSGGASSVVERDTYLPTSTDANINYFDQKKVSAWVADFALKVNKAAQNAKLGAKDSAVVVLANSSDGYQINRDTLTQGIQDAAKGEKSVTVDGEITKPEVTENNLEELGIKEHISTGWSDFRGSPKNRIHNVNNGASKFNGVLMKPGVEFSFNEALGPVEAYTGYLPELVILENKTVPQYGGGLCQVSSTAFRAALNAGLPIIERLNHAYPVSYYKPYGVDATIYLPKPDLVFKNDTPGYILIQTRIEGTKIYFDFYGTKVARTIKFSGNKDATKAVSNVENVTPYLYDQGKRGKGSFTAVFYRHIYDTNGKLTDNDKFVSKYDSPDKYPH